MVRLSDILKKKAQAQTSGSTPAAGPVEKEKPAAEKKKAPLQKPDSQAGLYISKQKGPEQMQIVQAMKEVQPDIEEAKKLYDLAIQLAKDFGRSLANTQQGKLVEVEPIKGLVEKVVNGLVLGDKTLIALFYNDYVPEEYPYNHMVNVLVMSVALGLELGYNKSQLNIIGLAAFLHDVGMIEFRDIAMKPMLLSKEEYGKIKQHPLAGTKTISRLKDIVGEVLSAVKEHHERMDGSGYPEGLPKGKTSKFAQIIAVADVYEALIHTRSYRKRYPPHEGLKKMLSMNGMAFDPETLKVLVNQVGIYPTGSWVELNTREMAKVIAANANFPLRPVINIIFDTAKERLKEPRLVNLAKQTNVYIKRPLSDEEVGEKIKE